jgi:capsular polysaccharide biosynthesis protein
VAGGYLYSHFLLDALPKCHALPLAGIELAEIDTFLANSVEAAYQRELLARAGVELARVVPRDRLDSLDLLQVERLVWVTPVRSGFFTPSWAIEFLRGLVGWSPQPRASRRIYISRGDAPRRRVVNEAEVRTFVETRGFEVVSAASLTVAEMARLMAGARCVVGAHGAGMVNVVFAPPPASVVELYGWHITAEYWLLCEQLGHRHHCLECAAPDGGREVAATKSKAVRNAADVIVDLDRLGRMLERII